MAKARKTCTQLRRKLEQHNFGSTLSPIYITVNLGIASLEEGETAEDLIGRALEEVQQVLTDRRESFPFGW